MLNDRDGEDSLGHIYRMLYARVCRAVSTAMRISHTTGSNIDELRLRLEAWDDIVGAKKDVLDIIEREDEAVAASLRDFFNLLSSAFEHVEVMIGLRATPSDGYCDFVLKCPSRTLLTVHPARRRGRTQFSISGTCCLPGSAETLELSRHSWQRERAVTGKDLMRA